MKKIALFVLLALLPLEFPTAASAQATQKVFTGPDAAFRFKYSSRLVDCTKLAPTQPPSSNVPKIFTGNPPALSVPDACMSQGPMCSAEPDSEAKTLACYGYPKDEFRSKPEFIAATFFVAEVEGATEKNCLQGSQYWNVEDLENAKLTNINGITFKVFEFYGGWAGGGQGGHAYRTFHKGKCYELGIQTAFENSGNYDPGTIEEWTKQDDDKIQKLLNEPLHSFTFRGVDGSR